MINDARERRKLKSKRINCDKCQMRFNKEQTFQAHMKKVHGDKTTKQLNLQKGQELINREMTFPKNTRNLRSYKILDSAPGPQQLKRIQ